MVDEFKEHFGTISFEQIPRIENKAPDAMATIASLLEIPEYESWYEFLVETIQQPAYDLLETHSICLLVGFDSPWYGKTYTYLKENILPPNLSSNQKQTFIWQTSCYTIIADTLYRRGLDGTFLCCLEQEESITALQDIHEGIHGTHSSSPSLAKKLMHLGYYWPNMEMDSYQFVKKCK